MYSVKIDDRTPHTALPRHAAVERAKAMSRGTYRTVRVVNDRGFERLLFRRGRLLESQFITRDRRRKRAPLS